MGQGGLRIASHLKDVKEFVVALRSDQKRGIKKVGQAGVSSRARVGWDSDWLNRRFPIRRWKTIDEADDHIGLDQAAWSNRSWRKVVTGREATTWRRLSNCSRKLGSVD